MAKVGIEESVGPNNPTIPTFWWAMSADEPQASGHWNIPASTVDYMAAYIRNQSGHSINVRYALYEGEPTWSHFPYNLLGSTETVTVANGYEGWQAANFTVPLDVDATNVFQMIHTSADGLEISQYQDGTFKMWYTSPETHPFASGAPATFYTDFSNLLSASPMFCLYTHYTSADGSARMQANTRGDVFIDGTRVVLGAPVNDDGQVWKTGATYPPGGAATARTNTFTVNEVWNAVSPGDTNLSLINRNFAADMLAGGNYWRSQIVMRFATPLPAGATPIRAWLRHDQPGATPAADGFTLGHSPGVFTRKVDWKPDGDPISASDYSATAAGDALILDLNDTLSGWRLWPLTNPSSVRNDHTKLILTAIREAGGAPTGINYDSIGGYEYGGDALGVPGNANELIIDYTNGPVPAADFIATSPRSGPGPLTVAFSDLSSNTPSQWAWRYSTDGGATHSDFTNATQQNPTQVFP